MIIAHLYEVSSSVILITLKTTTKKICISEPSLHYGFRIGEALQSIIYVQ